MSAARERKAHIAPLGVVTPSFRQGTSSRAALAPITVPRDAAGAAARDAAWAGAWIAERSWQLRRLKKYLPVPELARESA